MPREHELIADLMVPEARTPRVNLSRLPRSLLLLLFASELCIAAAFLLPGPSDPYYGGAMVIVAFLYATIVLAPVIAAYSLPGALVVFAAVALMERKRVPSTFRFIGAVAVSPALGAPLLILGGFDELTTASDWLFVTAPGVVFSIGSVWLGLARPDRPHRRSS